MLTGFARAFRTPDLRKKLLFTLGIIGVYRLGIFIPAPGIDLSLIHISEPTRLALISYAVFRLKKIFFF